MQENTTGVTYYHSFVTPIYDIYNLTSFNASDVAGDFDFLSIFDEYKINEYYKLYEPGTLALICLYSVIFFMAVLGNVTVMVVIISNRRMWSVTNNFLLNMAVADLMVTLVCVPMTVAERVYRLWIYGELLCKLTPYLQVVAVSASILTITTMSLDRCFAIRHPMKFRNIRTTKYVRVLIVLIWIISFSLGVPLLFVRFVDVTEIMPGAELAFCTESWSHRKIFDVCLLVIIFFIPGSIILISYLLMGRRLWVPDRKLSDSSRRKRGSRRGSECEKSMRNITVNRRRLAKLCIAIAIVFIITWTPYFIVNTYIDFNPSREMADVVSYTLLLGHIHCITNPILYCFLHKTFRHYILRCIMTGVKSQPNGGVFGQGGYITLYRSRSTPFKSHQRGSLRSISSNRRRSSSSSCYKQDDPLQRRGSIPHISTTVDVSENRGRYSFSPDKDALHIPRGINIPSCINEESKVLSTY